MSPLKHHAHARRLLAVALLSLLCCVAAVGARRERLIENWRPVHYDVALTFDAKLSELTHAETRVTIIVTHAPLHIVDLDFGALPIDAVRVGTETAQFEQRAGHLNVTLPHAAGAQEQLNITVTYHGRPTDGLILTNDKDGHPSATGDNWPDRVHNWIPSLDHPAAKATVNFNVTVPAGNTVVANGKLEGISTYAPGWPIWLFKESKPIPPYCMIVAVGKFAEVAPPKMAINGGHVIDLAYYVPPSEQSLALSGFTPAPLALKFYGETIAPYPYEKLAHIVGATRYGGMENSSAIVYSSGLLDPNPNAPVDQHFNLRRALVEVVAHETAHQWFGDAVTPATWADLWLSEGFATYFAGLFIEHEEGAAAFHNYMRRAADNYLTYERKRNAPIYDRDTEKLTDLLNENNYQKGAWVLHMLRAQLGDAKFFAGLRRYYQAHLNANATTEDLRAALEQESGQDLREFFTRWVYASGHPRYAFAWTWQARGRSGGVLTLTLRQTQTGEPFLMPLSVEIIGAGEKRRVLMKPTGRMTVLSVPQARRPSGVRLDPDDEVLKEVVTTQPAAAGGSI
jgi:aminopeptidase N